MNSETAMDHFHNPCHEGRLPVAAGRLGTRLANEVDLIPGVLPTFTTYTYDRLQL